MPGPADLPDRLRSLLQRLGLPASAPPLPLKPLAEALMRDKKLKGDALPWILVSEIGEVTISSSPVATLQDRLDLLIDRNVLKQSGG